MEINMSNDWRENGPVEEGEVTIDDEGFAVEMIEWCEFCGKPESRCCCDPDGER